MLINIFYLFLDQNLVCDVGSTSTSHRRLRIQWVNLLTNLASSIAYYVAIFANLFGCMDMFIKSVPFIILHVEMRAHYCFHHVNHFSCCLEKS